MFKPENGWTREVPTLHDLEVDTESVDPDDYDPVDPDDDGKDDDKGGGKVSVLSALFFSYFKMFVIDASRFRS